MVRPSGWLGLTEELRYADYCRTNPNWASRELVRLKATIADKDRVIEAVMEELKGQARYDCRVTNACAKRCIDTLAALLEKNDE